MNDKAANAKRLVIFLLFAFGLAWIPWIIMNKVWGYDKWFSTSHYGIFANLTLYAPAFANILTRLVTKEGFSDMKLHLRLKGHLRAYLIAWLLPVIAAMLTGVLGTALFGDFSGASELEAQGFTGLMRISLLLQSLFTAPLMAFVTFGEEFGWRGYMNDRMKPLLGKTGTVIIGGMLWGIWHAPLTVEGHNFGLDYPGYPYTGFLAMMLFCTLLGIPLMWLTEKTGSVYPAAICHGMLNFGSSMFRSFLLRGLTPETAQTSMSAFLVGELPLFVLSLAFIVPLFRKKAAAKASV